MEKTDSVLFHMTTQEKWQSHLKYVPPVHRAFNRQASSFAQPRTPSRRKNKYLE